MNSIKVSLKLLIISLTLLLVGVSQTTPVLASASGGLKELAIQSGVNIGSYYQHDIYTKKYNRIFKKEFNALTVGLFWNGGYRPSRAEYDFTTTDYDVDFGKKHNMEMFGQTLIWFEEIPDWVKETPREEIETVMNEHIDTVVGHYAGQITLWNVVNEAVDDEGAIRLDNAWAEAMGTEYISKAFIRAQAADPTAVLYYNEFDIESNTAKYETVKTLLTELKAAGVPVHALGWQLHVTPTSFDADTLLERMNEIADLGFDNYITELDVALPVQATAADYKQQKQTYKKIIETFLAARRHQTIIIWGLHDGDPYWLTRRHPVLFNKRLEKKSAYYGVQEALRTK